MPNIYSSEENKCPEYIIYYSGSSQDSYSLSVFISPGLPGERDIGH